MKETTNHKIRYPEPADPDTLAAYWKNQAEDVERELDAIAPKQIKGAAKKQLLIADSSGVVTAVTASGDVTNNESGVFLIGNEKVESKHLKDGTVVEGDLADKAVTSRKTKLTSGLVYGAGTKKSSGLYEDVPSLLLEITPAVESKLLIVASFQFKIEKATNIEGSISLDGAAEDAHTAILNAAEATSFVQATVSRTYLLTLSPALHTIKARFRSGGVGLGEVDAANSSFLSFLAAA